MANFPSISGEEAIKAFRKVGFEVVRQRGSHKIMKKEGHRYHLSIPVHKGKTLGEGLLKKLINDSGLANEEFLELL